MNSPNQTQVNGSDVQKYLQQMERKKEYNRSYYQNKIKPKRETDKQELERVKEKCVQLEEHIVQLQNEEPRTSTIIENLRKTNQNLTNENLELKQQVMKLKNDCVTIGQLLDAARQRNYELMMEKADHLLPNIQNLTLDSVTEKTNYPLPSLNS